MGVFFYAYCQTCENVERVGLFLPLVVQTRQEKKRE